MANLFNVWNFWGNVIGKITFKLLLHGPKWLSKLASRLWLIYGCWTHRFPDFCFVQDCLPQRESTGPLHSTKEASGALWSICGRRCHGTPKKYSVEKWKRRNWGFLCSYYLLTLQPSCLDDVGMCCAKSVTKKNWKSFSMHSNLQADGGVHVLNTQQINEHPWPLSARVPRLHFKLCGTLGYIQHAMTLTN